ncbi:hypothetical protein BCR33DRAFT_301366 [Rhizoclosmatium globosum]|uniref:Uncharacterized protein n=1 Tax=Rhizoclosmatium globosum TaxID=329046 RepID=A0A1Y2C6W5_9FUNG|nr:hypothetical protein BCR33DRAFT_301366 [Rhizoclosmatium globosum]|eukprot:ORY42637.1 hypothetical protein BCR33DRAFT_301366 [Rhizoclosmatium globosum]
MEPGLGTEQISCVICRGKVVVGGLGALCLSYPPQLSSLNRQPVSDNTLSSTPESISNMDSSLGMTGLPSISVQSIALPSYDPSLRSHIPSVCSRLPSTSVQSTLTALPSTSTSPYSRPNGRPNANSVNRLRKSKVLEYKYGEVYKQEQIDVDIPRYPPS